MLNLILGHLQVFEKKCTCKPITFQTFCWGFQKVEKKKQIIVWDNTAKVNKIIKQESTKSLFKPSLLVHAWKSILQVGQITIYLKRFGEEVVVLILKHGLVTLFYAFAKNIPKRDNVRTCKTPILSANQPHLEAPKNSIKTFFDRNPLKHDNWYKSIITHLAQICI